MWIARVLREALHAVLPERCAMCEREDEPARDRVPVCATCQANAPRATRIEDVRRGARSVPCASLCVATPETLRLVHVMKYRGGTRLARFAGRWMGEAWPAAWSRADCVLVPVPLHRRRLRERGFNQAALLAHGASERLGLPVWDGALARRRATRPQSAMDDDARARNVHDAFRWIATDAMPHRIVLVDDVVTSGATVCEAAEAIARVGAAAVSVLALLRALGHTSPESRLLS